MTTTAQNNQAAVEDILSLMGQGKLLDAFEKYYGDDVTMHDPMAGLVKGKEVNREREIAFVNAIAEVHAFEVGPVMAAGDQTSYWNRFEFSTTDGQRVDLEQIAWQKWSDGKIVEEYFLPLPAESNEVNDF